MSRPPDPTSLRQRALAAGVPPSTLRDRIKNGRKPRQKATAMMIDYDTLNVMAARADAAYRRIMSAALTMAPRLIVLPDGDVGYENDMAGTEEDHQIVAEWQQVAIMLGQLNFGDVQRALAEYRLREAPDVR